MAQYSNPGIEFIKQMLTGGFQQGSEAARESLARGEQESVEKAKEQRAMDALKQLLQDPKLRDRAIHTPGCLLFNSEHLWLSGCS